jgi:serine/threonine protein kinase
MCGAPPAQTGRAVAIKMVNVTDMREGVSTVALREIKFLREIKSPHVVALLDVFEHKNNLALVRQTASHPCCRRPACCSGSPHAGGWHAGAGAGAPQPL